MTMTFSQRMSLQQSRASDSLSRSREAIAAREVAENRRREERRIRDDQRLQAAHDQRMFRREEADRNYQRKIEFAQMQAQQRRQERAEQQVQDIQTSAQLETLRVDLLPDQYHHEFHQEVNLANIRMQELSQQLNLSHLLEYQMLEAEQEYQEIKVIFDLHADLALEEARRQTIETEGEIELKRLTHETNEYLRKLYGTIKIYKQEGIQLPTGVPEALTHASGVLHELFGGPGDPADRFVDFPSHTPQNHPQTPPVSFDTMGEGNGVPQR